MELEEGRVSEEGRRKKIEERKVEKDWDGRNGRKCPEREWKVDGV